MTKWQVLDLSHMYDLLDNTSREVSWPQEDMEAASVSESLTANIQRLCTIWKEGKQDLVSNKTR